MLNANRCCVRLVGKLIHSVCQGNGNPLQCSCLENPRDRGAWWAAVHGVAQSRTRLKWLSSSSSSSQGLVLTDFWELSSWNHHLSLRRQIFFQLSLEMRKLRHGEDEQLGFETRKSGPRAHILNYYTVLPIHEDAGWHISSPVLKKAVLRL